MVHSFLHCPLHNIPNHACGLLGTGERAEDVFVNSVTVTLTFVPCEELVRSFCFVLQDVSAESSLKWPELYKPGLRQELIAPLHLFLSLLRAIYASLVLFFIPFGVFYNTAFDYQTMAVTIAMAVFFMATIEVRIVRFRDACNYTELNKIKL